MPGSHAATEFFLSARTESGRQTNYFRPKAVTEIVFPDVGMIMYPMFWNKYLISLERQGYDLTEQDHLYLWAEREGKRDPTESVLYYSLRSLYATRRDSLPDIAVGESAASEWLFTPSTVRGRGLYDELVDHFLRVADGDPPPLNEFTEETNTYMSQRFRSRCTDAGFSFPDCFEVELRAVKLSDEADERERYDGVVTAFVRALQRAFEAVPALHRTRLGEVIIGSNIGFVRPLLEQAPEAVLDRSANTEFEVSADEANAFLEAVQAREHGEFLVGSILLISIVGPTQDRDAILNELRRLPDLYRSRADIVERARQEFPGADISPEVCDVLEQLCFFWSVNYFLADGEDLARQLIANTDGVITDDDLKEVFDERATADSFERFVELSTREQYATDLGDLIQLLESMGEDDVVAFLQAYRQLLGDGYSPRQLFVELLKWNGVLVDETEHYRVKAPIQENDSASFYGVDEVINWTKTLWEAVDNE